MHHHLVHDYKFCLILPYINSTHFPVLHPDYVNLTSFAFKYFSMDQKKIKMIENPEPQTYYYTIEILVFSKSTEHPINYLHL